MAWMSELEQMSMGSKVRDKNGDVWTRDDYGWVCGVVHASSDWLERWQWPIQLECGADE